MKKLVKVQEVEGEGMLGLMGEVVTLFCARFIYTGKLVGVNESCVVLEDPSIVYDTGAFDNPKWTDAQKLPKKEWCVMLEAVESFGVMK